MSVRRVDVGSILRARAKSRDVTISSWAIRSRATSVPSWAWSAPMPGRMSRSDAGRVACTLNLHGILRKQALDASGEVWRRWANYDLVGGPGSANSAARRARDLNDRHSRDGGGCQSLFNLRSAQRVAQGHGHVLSSTLGANREWRSEAESWFGTEAAAIGQRQAGAPGHALPGSTDVVLGEKARSARFGEPDQVPVVRRMLI